MLEMPSGTGKTVSLLSLIISYMKVIVIGELDNVPYVAYVSYS